MRTVSCSFAEWNAVGYACSRYAQTSEQVRMIIQNCTDFISKCNKVYFDYQNPCVRYNKIYLAFFKNITCYVFKYSSKKSRPLSLLLVSNCYHFHCRKRSPSAPQWRAVQTHQRAWEKARHLPEPCLYTDRPFCSACR